MSSRKSSTYQIMPKRLNTNIFYSNNQPTGERPSPPVPRKAYSLPTYLTSQQSWNPCSRFTLSQPSDDQHKIEALPGPTLYTAVLIARFRLHSKSKKHLASEPQLQAIALLLTILYGLLSTPGGTLTTGNGSHHALIDPIAIFSNHTRSQNDLSYLPLHSALLEERILLLVVITFIVFHGTTLQHNENNAIAVGHDIFIVQKFMFSFFQIRPTSHRWQTDRNRLLTDFLSPYRLRSHHSGHVTRRHSPIKRFNYVHRRRAFSTRRRWRRRRAVVQQSRRRRILSWLKKLLSAG
ncbi:hypothetical protein F5Y02DRAFT_169372 [Annulohypoxylon stygium]|nr:hypothetical protein F5Y02DRAFT_169372 [Annulohypoxylon stygium]